MNSITQDLDELLKKATAAIDSYHLGHWDLMRSLEERVKAVVNSGDVETAIPLLADIAYLKQPHKIDRPGLQSILRNYKGTIKTCLDKLQDIDRLDYTTLNYIADIPFFGRRGGRSFASVLLRLLRPDRYGIIDWRNMAVLASAQGFAGLISPPYEFSNIAPSEIIREKGHLLFSQDLYIEYNNILRELSKKYSKFPAEIDLILWVYSIEQLPFPPVTYGMQIFSMLFAQQLSRIHNSSRRDFLGSRVTEYITRLADIGDISPQLVRSELIAIFQFILDEFNSFSSSSKQKFRKHNMTILKIRRTLETSIQFGDGERLLAKWKDWESKVDPSSPSWTGHTNLPADMVMSGYVIFEDLILIRQYFESRYCDISFVPKEEFS